MSIIAELEGPKRDLEDVSFDLYHIAEVYDNDDLHDAVQLVDDALAIVKDVINSEY